MELRLQTFDLFWINSACMAILETEHVDVNYLVDLRLIRKKGRLCCDMGQNDTIGKIELNPSFVLSSDETNYKNDIQLFHQLFDELSVNRDYH